jgi:hypothetical protein
MASFLLAVFFIGIILLLAVLFDFVCFFLVFFKGVEIQDGKRMRFLRSIPLDPMMNI